MKFICSLALQSGSHDRHGFWSPEKVKITVMLKTAELYFTLEWMQQRKSSILFSQNQESECICENV